MRECVWNLPYNYQLHGIELSALVRNMIHCYW
jgi:hypothetical protein